MTDTICLPCADWIGSVISPWNHYHDHLDGSGSSVFRSVSVVLRNQRDGAQWQLLTASRDPSEPELQASAAPSLPCTSYPKVRYGVGPTTSVLRVCSQCARSSSGRMAYLAPKARASMLHGTCKSRQTTIAFPRSELAVWSLLYLTLSYVHACFAQRLHDSPTTSPASVPPSKQTSPIRNNDNANLAILEERVGATGARTNSFRIAFSPISVSIPGAYGVGTYGYTLRA